MKPVIKELLVGSEDVCPYIDYFFVLTAASFLACSVKTDQDEVEGAKSVPTTRRHFMHL